MTYWPSLSEYLADVMGQKSDHSRTFRRWTRSQNCNMTLTLSEYFCVAEKGRSGRLETGMASARGLRMTGMGSQMRPDMSSLVHSHRSRHEQYACHRRYNLLRHGHAARHDFVLAGLPHAHARRYYCSCFVASHTVEWTLRFDAPLQHLWIATESLAQGILCAFHLQG